MILLAIALALFGRAASMFTLAFTEAFGPTYACTALAIAAMRATKASIRIRPLAHNISIEDCDRAEEFVRRSWNNYEKERERIRRGEG